METSSPLASAPPGQPPRLSPNGSSSGRFRIGRYQMRSDVSPLADFMHDPASPAENLKPLVPSNGKTPGIGLVGENSVDDQAIGFDDLFLDVTSKVSGADPASAGEATGGKRHAASPYSSTVTEPPKSSLTHAKETTMSSSAKEVPSPVAAAAMPMITAGTKSKEPYTKSTLSHQAAAPPPLLARKQVSAPSKGPGLIGSLQSPLGADNLSIDKPSQAKEVDPSAMQPVSGLKAQKLTEQPPMPIFEGEGYVEVRPKHHNVIDMSP